MKSALRWVSGSPSMRVAVGVGVAAIGLLGTFLVSRLGSGGTPPAATSATTVDTLVVTTDLPQGTQIQSTEVTVKRLPSDVVPAGALTTASAAIGRYTSIAINRQQVLVPGLLVATPGTLVARTEPPPSLADGTVAISVPVDGMKGAGGYIQPGDHVDILVDTNGAGSIQYGFQDVVVLKVGSSGHSGSGVADLLLLELPRRQAEQIALLADGRGTPATIVRYVLRPSGQAGKGYLDSGPDQPTAKPPIDSPVTPSFLNTLFRG